MKLVSLIKVCFKWNQ